MGIDGQQAWAVIGGATVVANAVFWSAFLLGRMWNSIEWLKQKVGDHDDAIRKFWEAR